MPRLPITLLLVALIVQCFEFTDEAISVKMKGVGAAQAVGGLVLQ
jgi:hypothetical protein